MENQLQRAIILLLPICIQEGLSYRNSSHAYYVVTYIFPAKSTRIIPRWTFANVEKIRIAALCRSVASCRHENTSVTGHADCDCA